MSPFFLSEIMEAEKLAYFIYRNSVNGPVGFKEGLRKGSKTVQERNNCSLKKITSISKHAVCVSIHFHVSSWLFNNSQHSRDQAL